VSSHPGSRRDHDRFCQIEGWTEVRNARGHKVRHHITYELELPDGRVLRTRISRPANRETYGPKLWSAILEHQLCVTETEFWSCVNDKQLPDRGTGDVSAPAHALPAQLVFQLIHDAKVPEDQVAMMTLEQAMKAMAEYWSQPLQ